MVKIALSVAHRSWLLLNDDGMVNAGNSNHAACILYVNAQRKVSWYHTCVDPHLLGSDFMLDVKWSKIT